MTGYTFFNMENILVSVNSTTNLQFEFEQLNRHQEIKKEV
jgi:hypothetical protein